VRTILAAALLAGSLAAPALGNEAPCLPSVSRGAYHRCALDGGAIRLRSYFRRHAARVEDDLLHFNASYTLESMRDRDAWLRFGSVGGPGASALGAALFSGAVVGSAHGPLRMRAVHIGPAIFDGGGMGAGFGGRL
jgi:hypothetical protein